MAGTTTCEPDRTRTYNVRLGDLSHPSIYTLRYEFKPASVDPTRTGALTISSTDKAKCDMYNQTSTGPPISFSGKADPGKATDCMLIFDGEEFHLEGIATTVNNLTHDRLGGDMAAQRLGQVQEIVLITPNPAPPVDLDRLIEDLSDHGDEGDDIDDEDLEGSDDSFSE